MTAMGIPGTDEGDEALMLAFARGDAASFERLYARHKGPTYRYLLRHTSEPATADELHQDVWMKVVRARERYAPDARFTTWLYTLARHRLVDHWRSRRGVHFTSLDEHADGTADADAAEGDPPVGLAAGGDDPLTLTIDAQAGRRLVAALAGVPGPQRDAFLLHVEAGLSLEEIAQLAGVPAETIKSRLRYAYRKLRAALEDLQ
jgi:RNA polymerase sigma-70 factor (ECF subfamily)